MEPSFLINLAPNEAESEELSRSAALLYGLIHARYIITSIGLETMVPTLFAFA